VALVLAAGDRLNATKAGKLSQLAQPLCLLDDQALSACGITSTTVDAPGWEAVIWDEGAAALAAGDTILHTADLRTVQPGDPSPVTGEPLQLARGIEVGHIFQLGTKYSTAMEAVITDEQGQGQPMLMGCYGIGISRIVAAAIEQCHDARGIAWPAAMAPFQVAIAPLRTGNPGDEAVMAEAQSIHDQLEAQGVSCLLDDRGLRAGAMFSDLELIGIPWRVVVSTRLLEQDTLEYQGRHEPKATVKARHAVFQELLQHLA
jgi:prolyl-tRNA synthetase